uniref:SAP domain-containing protein n=1 Tax=Esox lucius TaxID=8010 RepID=A0AAY5L3B0_ESOLU
MSDKDVMLDGKPLQSLCLADLKAASEQRCLPKSGTKRALINRLKRTLMLENLQRTSTHHGGHQPNSRIGEEMSQNSFIKQYLAKQQELLRQRLEREAREAAEANESPAGSDLEKEGLTEVVNDSPSYCPNKETHSLSVQVLEDFKPRGLAPSAPPHSQGTEDTSLADGRQPTHSVLHLSRSAWAASRASVVKCLKDNSDEDDDSVEEDEEEWGPVAGARRGGGVGGGRAPQLKQPYPNVPAARERSRRKLQPPQHIPPQQVVHQPTMPLRQPTPPPSPPPELSFPLPETPKQSTPNMDEEPEAAGVAVRLLPGGFQKQDSDSSSRSSSPELLAQRRPGSLLARKMASEEVFEKRGERASDNPTDPIKVSRLEEEGFGESSRKKVSMPVKQDIIRLKHEKKSIRDIAKTLGLSKSTVWNIVKKQERTGELGDRKRPGRPQKTTLVDDQQMLAIVKKNPFSTVEQIKNSLQDLGIVVSTSTIRRRLHQHNFCVYHKTPTTSKTQQQNSQGTVCVWTDEMVNMYLSDENSKAGPDDVAEENLIEEVNDSPYYCPDKNPHSLSVRVLEDVEHQGLAPSIPPHSQEKEDTALADDNQPTHSMLHLSHQPSRDSAANRLHGDNDNSEVNEEEWGPAAGARRGGSAPQPQQPSPSVHVLSDMDEEQEEAGVAVRLLPGGLQRQDCESSSRSSSPEPQAHKRSKGVLGKTRKGASDSQTDPVDVSRPEKSGDGDSNCKTVSMPLKQDIIRLKHENKSIRDIAKTLGLSKSTVWYIVKKQERTGELSNRKRPGRPQKTTLVDDQQMLAIVKKNPFSTVEQIKNSLQDLGIVVSKSTIRRRLHQHNLWV